MRRLLLIPLLALGLTGCAAGALLCMGADKEIEERTDSFERVQCPDGTYYVSGDDWCTSSADCPTQPGDRAFCEEGNCIVCRPE